MEKMSIVIVNQYRMVKYDFLAVLTPFTREDNYYPAGAA
jgi:hypothetical protein